ncbi:MAG: DNA-formamidopyrimidine glycosylase family protein [Verrucomicrobiota bacterium]
MPELAEVEFYRKKWNPGLNQIIQRVALHGNKRIFRGTDVLALEKILPGRSLVRSEAHGKQMLFEFSGGLWIGLHLGMTGKLSTAPVTFLPDKHDHLVLYTAREALIFSDSRQFGRIRVHIATQPPDWWTNLPSNLLSKTFRLETLAGFLVRHAKLPIKAALLLQSGFPGVGNWMADEILWRARIHPQQRSGAISGHALRRLWREIRTVCRLALKHVSTNAEGDHFGDPPRGWLIHERWKRDGICPVHKTALSRMTVGGRTTAWCARCQPRSHAAVKQNVHKREALPPVRRSARQ